MHMNWFHPARESAAEQTDQFGHGEIEEGALALGFQRGGMAAAEISLDLRTPERPQVISGRRDAIVGAEQADVWVEFLRAVKRQEQFVGQAERQAACGLADKLFLSLD